MNQKKKGKNNNPVDKRKENLVNYKDLERNVYNEISKELYTDDKKDKK